MNGDSGWHRIDFTHVPTNSAPTASAMLVPVPLAPAPTPPVQEEPEPVPAAGPFQVWFSEGGVPTPNVAGNRVFMNSVTNKSSASGSCFIHDGSADNTINCPPGTLVSLELPSDLRAVGSKFPVWFTATSSGDTVSTAGNKAQDVVVGGPLPPWMWASGGNGKLLVGWDASPGAVTGQINAYIVQTRQQNADASWPDWTDTEKAATLWVAQKDQKALTDIVERIRGSPVAHADETAWRKDGHNGAIHKNRMDLQRP